MKIPERYKGQLLLSVLIVFLPMLTIRYSVGKTIGTIVSYTRQQNIYTELKKKQGVQSDKGNDNTIFCASFPNTVFSIITQENCSIDNYIPFTIRESGGFILETHQLVIKGEFIPMVRIIEKLENGYGFFKIISVEFSSTSQAYRGDIKELKMTLLIQDISTI